MPFALTCCSLLAQAPTPTASSGQGLMVWAIVCLGVAGALFVLEVFVPSGGILGAGAMIALVVGVVLLFRVDTTLGLVGAMLSLIALPIGFFVAMKVWPETPFAKWVTLDAPPPSSAWSASPPDDIPEPGTAGVAATDLRPVGFCTLGGRRIQCVAIGGMIEAGDRVEVATSRDTEVCVRKV